MLRSGGERMTAHPAQLSHCLRLTREAAVSPLVPSLLPGTLCLRSSWCGSMGTTAPSPARRKQWERRAAQTDRPTPPQAVLMKKWKIATKQSPFPLIQKQVIMIWVICSRDRKAHPPLAQGWVCNGFGTFTLKITTVVLRVHLKIWSPSERWSALKSGFCVQPVACFQDYTYLVPKQVSAAYRTKVST